MSADPRNSDRDNFGASTFCWAFFVMRYCGLVFFGDPVFWVVRFLGDSIFWISLVSVRRLFGDSVLWIRLVGRLLAIRTSRDSVKFSSFSNRSTE